MRDSPKIQLIDSEAEVEMYEALHDLISRFHEDLEDATIALAWKHDYKPDPDGWVCQGETKRAPEMWYRTNGIDIMILINSVVWSEMPSARQIAFLDMRLCEVTPKLDSRTGAQEQDVTGRKAFRMRRPPIVEFPEVVQRHKMWVSDYQKAAEASYSAQAAPLLSFDDTEPEIPVN